MEESSAVSDSPSDLKVIMLPVAGRIAVIAHDGKYEFPQQYDRIDDVEATIREVQELAFDAIRKKYQ